MNYPPTLLLSPLTQPPAFVATVPGSKSITNRALVLAAVASRGGPCRLTGALRSEDTDVMIDSLRKLGFDISEDWARSTIDVGQNRSDRVIPAATADLFVANSGTTMRFLTALVAAGVGRYRLDGVARMRERPIRDLLDALNQLDGVTATSEAGTDCPPVVVNSMGLPGGQVTIRAGVSSQFLSGLLMAAPAANAPLTVAIEGPLVSEPYIAMTVAMMQTWSCEVTATGNEYRVMPGDRAGPAEYAIEPDASAASYFWAAAVVTGGRVTVAGLTRASMQGDVKFVDALARMGCRVEECDAGITVHGRPLTGIDIDMNEISDTAMTLAAVACFATGSTTIRNIAHVRHKETDRIAAVATELRNSAPGSMNSRTE